MFNRLSKCFGQLGIANSIIVSHKNVPRYYCRVYRSNFTARNSYASAVLGIVILSVCPSIRLSLRLSVHPTYAYYVTKRKNIQLNF